jgi:excisionase family DNA binding protein
MFMRERWLSVGEIAVHLGVNPDTIYKWIDRKKMPAHKLGRLWKFLASEVDEWVKDGSASGRGRPKPAGQ